jgi:hypothetical protein
MTQGILCKKGSPALTDDKFNKDNKKDVGLGADCNATLKILCHSGESSPVCGVIGQTPKDHQSTEDTKTPTSGATAGHMYAIGGIRSLNGGIWKVCASLCPRPGHPTLPKQELTINAEETPGISGCQNF